MKASLRVNQLSVQVKSNQQLLVEPVSFELFPQEPLCILGETGAGKSLLAHAILGSLTSDLIAQGEVYVEEQEILHLPLNHRQKLWGHAITLLPQEPWLALDPTMRSFAQLEETHRLVNGQSSQQAPKTAMERLKNLGLTGIEKKLPSELSGGMAQRLAFACTIAGGSRILLVDEPTKGLDVTRRNDLMRILLQFVEQQGALLTITHDVEVVRQLGGKTIVMKEGKVQEYDKTSQVLSQPQSEYAGQLIAAAPMNWQKSRSSTDRAGMPVVQVEKLSMSRGGNQLFSDLSFRILPGEIVGVFGPSGCGKSTLGDLLLDLLTPDSGTIQRPPHWQRQQFLKLYQDPPATVSPFWKLKDLLDDLIRLHRLNVNDIEPLMKQLKLSPDLLTRKPDAISGGELQRFSIFRSLLLKPLFLFADEPTSRLDPITQQETIELLCTTARAQQCALLLVSHDPSLIQKTCDSVIEL